MFALLTLLADGQFHSFQELTALLKVNPEHLNKALSQLTQQHPTLVQYDDEQVRLIPPCPLLNQARLSTALAPYPVQLKPVIPSTNQYLLEHIHHLSKGEICLAEYQSAGRGRRGRQWQSPFAGQIILSCYWTLPTQVSLNGLSLVIGISIAETLQEIGAKGITLKWPNDVLLNGKKLAGVLVEIANKNNGLINLVIGIGINIAISEQQHQIDQPWAELRETLPHIDREQLITRLIHQLYENLTYFEQNGIRFFQSQWLKWDHFINQEVTIISEKETICGTAQGIDEEGYLLLATEHHSTCLKFNSGEVSLRKK